MLLSLKSVHEPAHVAEKQASSEKVINHRHRTRVVIEYNKKVFRPFPFYS